MWEPDEIRTVRWFMRFAGVALAIPGLIYLFSWPDTLRAFAPVVGATLAPVGAGLSVGLLLLAGGTFMLARHARIGAVAGVLALLLGSFVHWRWSSMMNDRLDMLPTGLGEGDLAMIKDTFHFAANAQIPHILKNLVLVGLCFVVFLQAPKLCGSRLEGASPEA